ncbi:hypothetical protein TWF718_000214 [Orbilia javanica]|uniref:Uncharacterized protein n=1 Tax=Orbilia javanica TaxID=47235 RepID=A0AAN8MZB9_9PEZI
MLNSGRPGQIKVVAIAISVLLMLWLSKLNAGNYLLPVREVSGDWEQKKVNIEDSATMPIVEVVATPTPIPETGISIIEAEILISEDDEPTTTETQTPTDGNGSSTPEDEPTETKSVGDSTQSPTGEAKTSIGKAKHEKAVIMGKTWKEDATWVKEKLPDWRPVIYAVDSRTDKDYLHVLVNKGRESMPYLTYLIDFYDDLSDINVFIHAHENGYPRAWHNDPQNAEYSAVKMLQFLRLDNIREKGYVNLRCTPNPGCPAELHPQGQFFDKGSIEIGWKKLWGHMYGNDSYPESVGVACCAQFAVTKQKIHEQPKEFYEKLMDWLLTTDEEDAGRVFEYFWHIIFGMSAVHCDKSYSDCVCEVYNCTAGAGKRRSLNKLLMKRVV